MAAMSFMSLFVSLFLGIGVGGIPLATPPLPEDPIVARLAPEKCLWYWSSAGFATPDPASANHTEQLLAEAEVQRLIKTIETQIMAAIEKEANGDRAQDALARELPLLIKLALTRPLSAYVASFQLVDGRPQVEAGLVLNAGKQVGDLEASLSKLERLTSRGEPVETIESDGITWHALPLPPPAPPVQWGIKKQYLFVAIGEEAAAKIVERARSGPPAWLTQLKTELAIERLSTVSYINIEGILEAAQPALAVPKVRLIVDVLGLANVQHLAEVTGLDREGCTSHLQIAIDGKPQGIFALVDGQPLVAGDLQGIPRDALFALAVRFDAAAAFRQVLDMAAEVAPQAVDSLQRDVGETEEILGAKIGDDLLGSLGHVWTLHASPADGQFPYLGAVASVTVQDHARLQKSHDRVLKLAQKELPNPAPRRRGITLRHVEAQGKTIHFLNSVGEEMPIAPAWCLTEDRFIVGLFPQAITSFLSRGSDAPSLANVPQVAAALDAADPPLKLIYTDTKKLVETFYPLIQIGAQLACSEMQREGIDVNISLLPAVGTIAKHVQPSLATVARTKAGFLVTQRGTIPGTGMLGAIPLGAALVLPAVTSARSAAKTAVEMNQLKQIAIAYHNAVDDSKRLPQNIVDAEGKPLLSWRVALLPYLEQTNLYDQFHLDEPWNSEHNRKLIALMPHVYRSQNLPAPAGKTRFVGFQGKQTVFSGEKIGFKDVVDGSSRTLMVVQAPGLAVDWTKPEDITYDPKNPALHLAGPDGTFLAVFCDSSVRRIANTIDAQILNALITYSGEEVVDFDAIPSTPGAR